MKALARFFTDERGLETVEYAVLTALIVATLIAAVQALEGAIETRFGEVTGHITAIN